MARKPKTPNAQLKELVTQARYSHKGLAKRVNDLGNAEGIADLSYDHSSVKRWLHGQQPKQPIPHLVAQALSERLGFRVNANDVGMQPGEVTPSLGLDFALSPTDGIEHVTTLWEKTLRAGSFCLAAPLLASRSRRQRCAGLPCLRPLSSVRDRAGSAVRM